MSQETKRNHKKLPQYNLSDEKFEILSNEFVKIYSRYNKREICGLPPYAERRYFWELYLVKGPYYTFLLIELIREEGIQFDPHATTPVMENDHLVVPAWYKEKIDSQLFHSKTIPLEESIIKLDVPYMRSRYHSLYSNDPSLSWSDLFEEMVLDKKIPFTYLNFNIISGRLPCPRFVYRDTSIVLVESITSLNKPVPHSLLIVKNTEVLNSLINATKDIFVENSLNANVTLMELPGKRRSAQFKVPSQFDIESRPWKKARQVKACEYCDAMLLEFNNGEDDNYKGRCPNCKKKVVGKLRPARWIELPLDLRSKCKNTKTIEISVLYYNQRLTLNVSKAEIQEFLKNIQKQAPDNLLGPFSLEISDQNSIHKVESILSGPKGV
ncbi:MAG: hypothetical protein ACFFCS_03720 [Candidatus Hodarchaeota archaeon]